MTIARRIETALLDRERQLVWPHEVVSAVLIERRSSRNDTCLAMVGAANICAARV